MTEKISKGMYILLREGTLSLDVAKLIKGVTPYTLRRCAFCTDDRFVGEIIRDGSIDPVSEKPFHSVLAILTQSLWLRLMLVKCTV